MQRFLLCLLLTGTTFLIFGQYLLVHYPLDGNVNEKNGGFTGNTIPVNGILNDPNGVDDFTWRSMKPLSLPLTLVFGFKQTVSG